MSETIKCHMRKVQVLRLLKIHGPLSFRVLSTMLAPPMQERRLHDCLARLSRRDLIEKRNERVFRGAGVFYQLAQDEKSRTAVGKILKCPSQELSQPHFSYRSLIHSELCAVWVDKLKHLFPDALIIRDFEFPQSDLVKKIMLSEKRDVDLNPDLLIVFQSKADPKTVAIAVEIERSRKSEERLMFKLRKYARGTLVDGLLYLCDSKRVAEVIRRLYQDRVLQQPVRIKHYGDHFVLFSNALEMQQSGEPKLYNSRFEPVSLTHWATQLRGASRNFRRDSQFSMSAVSC